MEPGAFRRLAAILLAGTAAAGGCAGDDEPERWSGPGIGLGALPVSEFEERAQDVDEAWERAPALAAAEFVRVDRTQARATSITATTGPEGGPRATATVTLDGLLDDSVRARRYVLDLRRRDDGTWRLASALATQRCWPRRGHQGFAPRLCR